MMMHSECDFAIIGAMDQEIESFVYHLKESHSHQWNGMVFHQGILFGASVVIAKCGVGKVLASMTTQKIIDTFHPAKVIFTGVAGALNPKYEIGDIVVAHDCAQHDVNAAALGFTRGTIPYTNFRFFKTDEQLRKLAFSAEVKYKIHEGRVLTGDQFFSSDEMRERQYLVEDLKGDAVEMEGAAVAQVCVIHQIPFLLIRTISDKADKHSNLNFNEFLPQVAGNSLQIIQHLLKNSR